MHAFTRAQDIKTAVNSCVELNQWDLAMQLAQEHKLDEIEELLFKYANHLVEKNRIVEAIELYQKANRNIDAAKLLAQVAHDAGRNKMQPKQAKMLYVMAALEIEKMRKRLLDNQLTNSNAANAKKAVQQLLQQDNSTAFDKKLDNAWKGAEAYHYFMLAQRQLYDEKVTDALVTAQRLADYEDVLGTKEVYSLIALAAYFAGKYKVCSRAFIRLESMHEDDTNLKQLAIDIFTRNAPTTLEAELTPAGTCPNCEHEAYEHESSCSQCATPFYPCTVTGKTIFSPYFWSCDYCKHRALESVVYMFQYCPLCHSKRM